MKIATHSSSKISIWRTEAMESATHWNTQPLWAGELLSITFYVSKVSSGETFMIDVDGRIELRMNTNKITLCAVLDCVDVQFWRRIRLTEFRFQMHREEIKSNGQCRGRFIVYIPSSHGWDSWVPRSVAVSLHYTNRPAHRTVRPTQLPAEQVDYKGSKIHRRTTLMQIQETECNTQRHGRNWEA